MKNQDDELKIIEEALSKEPLQPFEKDLTRKILHRLEKENKFKKKPPFWPRYVAASLIATLFLAVFTLLPFRLSPKVLNSKIDQGKTLIHPATIEATDWLVQAQQESGAWDAEKWGGHRDFTVGLTGLSLMALQENQNEKTKLAIDRAKKYLLQNQKETGLFGPLCQGALYNHSIATLALLESYAREANDQLKLSIDQGIDLIIRSQDESGGWGYLQSSTNTVNTSLSVWQLNALVMAKALSWENLEMAIDHGQAWLQTTIDKEGRSRYSHSKKFPYGHRALTAMANYCFKIMNNDQTRNDTNIDSLLQAVDSDHLDFYRDFFIAAAAQLEEKEISQLKKQIANAQVRGGKFKGSWYPEDRWGSAGGRVYATSMAVLALQAGSRAQRTRQLLAWKN